MTANDCNFRRQIERLQPYYDAVDDEAVTTFTLSSKLTPREQLHSIINWHIQVATDPAVNGGEVLVDKAHVERLQARVEQLEGALLEIVKETDGIDCDGCYVRNEIARKALGAGTEYPEAPEQQEPDGE